MFRNQRRQLFDHVVAAGQLDVGNRRPFDPHRRETNRVMASEGVEHPGFQSIGRQSPRLGYEQRVPGPGVPRAHHRVVVVVDVGRDHVNLRRPGPPDVQRIRHGAAALAVGVLIVFCESGRPRVDEHRQRIFGFARLGRAANVAREIPGHEYFIGRGALAEHIFPGAGGFETVRLPYLAQFRNQAILVLLQVIHEFPGHRVFVSLGGQRRAVAGIRHSDFVLHLNHHDRMFPAIHGFDVMHQGCKGAGIGVAVCIAERSEHFDAPARGLLGAWEPLEIPLHPVGRVGGLAVLPAREPQQHETQVMIPRFPDHAVEDVEVELSFHRFDLGPGNGGQNAVEFRVNELGPDRFQVFEAGGGVVAQFSRERQERLAVHDQLGGASLLPQMRNFRSRIG